MATSPARSTWLGPSPIQLPARPPHLRVRIWRRLQQVGAAVLRNSIYVLPNTAEAREDLEWVRSEIVAHRGQASLLEASALDGSTDRDLIAQLRADRDAEYQALMKDAARAREAARRTENRLVRRSNVRCETLKDQLAAIAKRGLLRYAVPSRRRSADRRNRGAASGAATPPAADRHRLQAKQFKGRVWLTRPRPGIDRMASAWFIRRFIDRSAWFRFADAADARDRRSIPFDMADVEFGHHGASCTFETLVRRFGVADPADAAKIAEIVQSDLDLKETRFGRPEAAAVGRIVEGLRAAGASDPDLLERGGLDDRGALPVVRRRGQEADALNQPRSASIAPGVHPNVCLNAAM